MHLGVRGHRVGDLCSRLLSMSLDNDDDEGECRDDRRKEKEEKDGCVGGAQENKLLFT